MGLFSGRRPRREARELVLPPGFVRSSYDQVDLSRAEQSLQSVAVWSAVDLLSSLVSELPIDVYRGWGVEREHLRTPPWLLDPGADGHGLEDWLAQLMGSWLLRGNTWGIVRARNPRGDTFATAVELLHPDHVSGRLVAGEPVFAFDGRDIPAADLFHRRVYPIAGVATGMSPIEHHATTIGLGIAVTRFGAQWFKDGAHPGGMLTNTEVEMTPTLAQEVKRRFLASLRGTREPLVLGKGWNYQQIQVAPEESQFLQTHAYTDAQCARIFGPGVAEVLGYESGGSMTYSNVESRATHLLVYAVNRWLRRAERALGAMLPRGQYVRFNRDALLQSTTLTRFQAHELSLRNQWATVNEVRAIEDKPPVSWGDEPNPPGAAINIGGNT